MNSYELQNMGNKFYTTKEKGTGLGIPFIKKTIEEHRGKLEIYSKKGRGTKIKIILPKEKV